MTNLTIKNIPQGLYQRLKSSAEAGRRSLNGEVIHRLEQSVGTAPSDGEALVAEIRVVRERPVLPYLTDEALRRAREEGRA